MGNFGSMGDGFELTEGDFVRIGPRISKRSGEGQKGAPETPFLYYPLAKFRLTKFHIEKFRLTKVHIEKISH